MLIAGRADADARDEYGKTPMHWAAQHRRTEVVQAMLESDANPNPTDNSEETPLHIAASLGQTAMVHALLTPEQIRAPGTGKAGPHCTGRPGPASPKRHGCSLMPALTRTRESTEE